MGSAGAAEKRATESPKTGREKYVAVASEVLEQLDFSQSALSKNLLAEDVGDFLDGDTLAGLGVGRGTVRGKQSRDQ